MVKKLFKHEILAYLRVWLPMQIILISVALFTRIIQIFETDNTVYDIISGSSSFLYTVAVIASIGLVVVFGITRFYKNMFTNEGYLSFTLPVTSAQHLCVKGLTASMFTVMTFILDFISFMIVTAGDVFSEIMKTISYALDKLYEYAGYHSVFYVIETVLIVLLSIICMYLFYYGCISIGQLFKKNRVIGAIGVYFIYQTVTQILGTVTVAVISMIDINIFKSIIEFMEKHILGTIHVALCTMLVFELILIVLYFIVSHTVMRKKLNLE